MKNHMITYYITLDYWLVPYNVIFSSEISSTFKVIKLYLKQSYDKQNLTPVIISYEIHETHQRLVSEISYELIMFKNLHLFPELKNILQPSESNSDEGVLTSTHNQCF